MSRPVVRRRAVFRLPGISFLIPFLFFVAVTPLANGGSRLLLALYVLPLVGLIYILVTRTVADDTRLSTMGLLGIRRIPWAELDGLEFHGPRWAIAVALDGRRIRLPMVRPRDLPRLAAVSGGRLLLGKDAPAPVDPAASEEADALDAVNVGDAPETAEALEAEAPHAEVPQAEAPRAEAPRAGEPPAEGQTPGTLVTDSGGAVRSDE